MIRNKSMNKLQVPILTILGVSVMCSATWAATYYADATNGKDSHTGMSSAQAWKSLSKVNGESFSPGDNIYFKCGETSH